MPDGGTVVGAKLVESWNRFWFAEGNTFSLGVFRVLFALCLLWEIPVTRAKSVSGIEGGFHLPYFPFINPLPAETYHTFHEWQYFFAILLLLGLIPRIASGALFLLQGYVFFTDQLHFRNHPYLFLLVLLILVFAPSGESLSAKSFFRWMQQGEARVGAIVGSIAPLTAQRLIQVQVSIVYFYAALHKLTPEYLSGQVLADQMADNTYGLSSDPSFWLIPAVATVLLELGLAFVLWIPRWRGIAMLIAIPFHLTIAVLMDIGIFSAAMIATFVLFLDPDTLPRLVARMRDRSKANGRQGRKQKKSASPQ